MRTYKYKLWNHRKGIGIMRRYPEYKESGMEWIGEIPKHWKVKRAKFMFRQMQRPVREHDEVITAFRDGIVTLRKNRRTLGFTNSLKEIGYQGLRKGDLVIHAMDGHAGAIGVSDSDGKSSPVYSVCLPISQENVYYYAYLLRYMALSGFIQSLTKGVRERSTEFRFNEFKKLDLPVPSISEQDKIVNFLDRKTGQIDELIRIKERRTELLQEQRTTLINQAVTKGLDPNVEMKPSGVEWIGEMPKYREVTRLKYICELIIDCEHKTAPTQEIGCPLIRTPNIGIGHLMLDGVNRVSEATYQEWSRRTIPQSGDLILAREAPVGNVAIIPKDLKVCLGQRTVLIRPHKNMVCSMFLVYLMLGDEIQTRLLGRSTGAIVHHLNMADIRNLELPRLPFLSTQRKIVDFLNRKTKQIDELIAAERRKIELLKEYRQSLISEAVTGKIDVRNEV